MYYCILIQNYITKFCTLATSRYPGTALTLGWQDQRWELHDWKLFEWVYQCSWL